METRAVILADPTLNERQKQVLLQIYESFRKENGFEIAPADAAPAQSDGHGEKHGDEYGDKHGDSAAGAQEHDRTTDGSDADPHQTAS